MQTQIGAVIIEDEVFGRQALASLIKNYITDLKIIGEAADVDSGVKLIIETKPQVVFLDIRLGNRSGFDIIRQVPVRNFSLIVTSAYEEYALEAFRLNAIDYLLKPVTKEDLMQTMQRVYSKILVGHHDLESQWPAIQHALDHPVKGKIAVPSASGLIFISLNQILRCEADGPYTKLIMKSGLPVLTTRNLGEYEKVLLPTIGFLRIHHSVIINMNEVVRYIRGDGGEVVMTDGVKVDVSRRKKNEFMEWIEKI